MVVLTLPLLAWWLDVTMFEALLLELFLIVFITVYMFVYNWAFDVVVPVKTRVLVEE